VCAGIASQACGTRPLAGRESLVVAYPYGPDDLLSYRSVDEISNSILRNAYEPLVDLGPDLRLVPCLAESWYNPDELTWVFRLRSGVRLHDGRTLEAGQVAAFMRRALDDPRSLRSPGSSIASVEVERSDELVIRTSRPVGWLPAQLARLLVSVEASDAGAPPVGSGPYAIREWTPRGSTRLEAFGGHRDGRAPIGSLVFRAISDLREAVRQLAAGKVDLMPDVPLASWDTLKQAGIRRVERPGLRVVYLGLNTLRGRGPRDNPLCDVRVRRAIAHALDLRVLLEGPLRGAGEPVHELVPPEIFGSHGGLESWRFEPEESRRLLAEARATFSRPLVFDWEKGRYPGVDAAATAITDGLRAVGIPVRPQPRDPGAIGAGRQFADSVDLYIRGWLHSSGDAGASYEYLLHTPGAAGQGSLSLYSNPAVDRELAEAGRPVPAEQRRRHLIAVAQIAHDDVAVVPLFRQVDRYAYAAGLEFRPRLDRRIRAWELRWSAGAQ